ncbi:hypothetical protein HD554DRAFT_2017818, partial [Boletus coccyginus]
FFIHLENQHFLDYQNLHHLWLLQTLFLLAIHQDGLKFQCNWNCYPMDGADTNNKSPKVSKLFGVYQDDCDGIHPDTINKYYGIYGDLLTCQGYQLDAGHLADEEVSGDNNVFTAQIVKFINQQQQAHANQDVVHISSYQIPFTNAKDKVVFFSILHEIINHATIPNRFGLTPVEWETR